MQNYSSLNPLISVGIGWNNLSYGCTAEIAKSLDMLGVSFFFFLSLDLAKLECGVSGLFYIKGKNVHDEALWLRLFTR